MSSSAVMAPFAREVEVDGSDTRMRGVLLAAPDRQRGTRQRDGENGGEQCDSSHSHSLVVATVEDARRRLRAYACPGGVQSAREDERDGRDHGGQGRAAHCAEEERLGRVGGERDRQRRATLDSTVARPGSVRAARARRLARRARGSTSARRGGCGTGAAVAPARP